MYRVGNHQPRNVYRGDDYIGVMFSAVDAAAVVRFLNYPASRIYSGVSMYRVDEDQPQDIYRGSERIGVMFSPIDAAAVVRHLAMGEGECTCSTYEPCAGECCGVGMCTCTPGQPVIAVTDEDVTIVRDMIDQRVSPESVRAALAAVLAHREQTR